LIQRIKRFFLTLSYRNIGFALLGSAIIAFATYNIHANSNIPEGGIIGLSLIIEYFTGVSPAISNLVMNALCCLMAWRLMGTKYMVNASIATIGFSAFYALFSLFPPVIPDISEYPLLATLVGAILIEVGTGITLRFGSAPSGDHALAMALVRRGGLDFGWVNFLRDFIVIFASLSYVDDPYLVVYSLLIMTFTAPIVEIIAKVPNAASIKKKIVRTKRGWIPRIIVGLVVVALLTGATMFVNNYNRADSNAIKEYVVAGVEEKEMDEGIIAYIPEGEIKAGLVFYPGGRVEFTSYAPLLKKCAEEGILCVVVEMPYNLAFLGINKGVDVPSLFPEIKNWYIGGHSLGATIAANCASNHSDIFKGVVLLASYSTANITDLRVLSVYGSEDGILNMSNYDKFKDNLPASLTERVIIGGNHSYFGMYGVQNGDKAATVSNAEQIELTASYIVEFILK
jgi:uncharacterized membrane-anchored protein YitT (DUF2179 family)